MVKYLRTALKFLLYNSGCSSLKDHSTLFQFGSISYNNHQVKSLSLMGQKTTSSQIVNKPIVLSKSIPPQGLIKMIDGAGNLRNKHYYITEFEYLELHLNSCETLNSFQGFPQDVVSGGGRCISHL